MQINQNYLVNVLNKQSEEQLNSTCLRKTMFIELKKKLKKTMKTSFIFTKETSIGPLC